MLPLDLVAFGSVAALAGGWLAVRPAHRAASAWRVALTADFSTLEQRDPLLAALLTNAMVEGPAHQRVLSLEPWDGGMMRAAGALFRHRGMFFEPRDGSVGFLFVLEKADDETTITYAGALTKGGRRISYSILRRPCRSALGQRVELIWEDPG
jgi:hypothetical protein